MENKPEQLTNLSPVKLALLAQRMRSTIEGVELLNAEPIAIVGMGCRFPGGSDNPEAFWRLLSSGADAITEIPPTRWDVNALYDPDPEVPGKMFTRWGAFLSQVDQFDPAFFGISPREAICMDPQQRLFLETAWEALEDAGLVAEALAGSKTSVFVGASSNDYAFLQFDDPTLINAYSSSGAAASILANRLSYLLDLRGPSMTVDTACSSSLVAIYLACQSLHTGESDLALVGGVNLILAPESTIAFSKLRAIAPDGRCKTFDARADGYGRGEGCGVLILKRLSSALLNRDRVLALVRGVAVNQDGRSNGLTAPNMLAQQQVIRQALDNARITPNKVTYIEAHGTGTPLGDPIEVEALKAVYGQPRPGGQQCAIGSVKTNIGHLEAAAGIAGVIKTILALQHRAIPPHLQFTNLNPHISLAGTPLCIPTALSPWHTGGEQLCAAVSSFGFGGVNAHVVLEEAPTLAAPDATAARTPRLLALSAKNDAALHDLAGRYVAHLAAHPDLTLVDLCATANTGRSHFSARLATVATSVDEVRDRLAAFAARPAAPASADDDTASSSPLVAFLFSGQGAQYAGMGRQLYEREPVFRQTVQHCDTLLRPYLDRSLTEVLFPSAADSPALLEETAYAQPALFALEYALAQVWRAWGIEPDRVLGHSLGEYTAACLAGVFSLEDGLKLVAARGRLMQTLVGEGAMTTVWASEKRISELLRRWQGAVTIAAVNGPEMVVIAGTKEAVVAVEEVLTAQGLRWRRLTGRWGFHSPWVEPMLARWRQIVQEVRLSPPHLGLIAGLSGQVAGEDVAQGEYWVRQVRESVRYATGIETLQQAGVGVYVEMGPGVQLAALGRRIVEDEGVWTVTLREGHDEEQQMLESLGQAYEAGVKLDWAALERGQGGKRVALPTYPFQRERFWIVDNASPSAARRMSRALVPHALDSVQALHPLLDHAIYSPAIKETIFETQLKIDALPFLRDHQIIGRTVLPASAYLEMVLAAATATWGPGVYALEAVAIQEALVLSDQEDVIIQCVLTPVEDRAASFQIFSRASGAEAHRQVPWRLHVTGQVHPGSAPVEQDVTIEEARADCKEGSPEEYYAHLRERGIEYGQSFQAVTRIWYKSGQAVGYIQLPAQLSSEADPYCFHPVLMDACFQMIGATLWQDTDPSNQQSGEQVYLPIGLERCTVFQQPRGTLWCHALLQSGNAVNAEQITGMLHIFDETGQLVAQVEGMRLKRTRREVLSHVLQARSSNLLYKIVWRQAELPASIASSGRRRLIFADAHGVGAALAAQQPESWLVYPGTDYARLADRHYQLNVGQPRDFARLLDAVEADGTGPWTIVYLWGLDSPAPTQAPLMETLERTHGALLHLLHALVERTWTVPPRLWIVTAGAQPVAGMAAELAVAQTPLWGVGRVIGLEHPELWGGLIDLERADDASIEQLGSVIEQQGVEPEWALRGMRAYVPRLVRWQRGKERRQQEVVRGEGSYVVTGGLGGLGLTIARWLVQRGARRVVLAGRHEPGEKVRQVIAELQEHGAEVVTRQVDAAERVKIEELFREEAARPGGLRGVVHAVGELADGILREQQWEKFARVLKGKGEGAWVVADVAVGLAVDWVALFGSTAGVWGSAGQGNYAAANALVDGVAQYWQGHGKAVSSVDWGPWGQVGLAAQQKEQVRQRWAAQGIEELEPAAAVQALEEVLSDGSEQVVAVGVDWERLARGVPMGVRMALLTELAPGVQQRKSEAGQFWKYLEQAPVNARRSLLVQHIHEQVAQVLGLGPDSPLGLRQGFFDTGMDSLMAVELKNRLQTSLGRSFASTLALDYPSIEALVEYLSRELPLAFAEELLSEREASSQKRAEFMESLAQLPEEDVQQMLEKKLAAISKRRRS